MESPVGRDRLLERISLAILETNRRTRTVVEVPPYVGFLDTECTVPWTSCAFAFGPVAAGRAQAFRALETLCAAFSRARRTLRFELFDRYLPGHASILEAAGFTLDGSDPILVLDPRTAAFAAERPGPFPAELSLIDPDDVEAVWAFVRASRLAFGPMPGGASESEEVEATLRDLRSGRIRCARAAASGTVVSVATLVGMGPLVELAGVGTVPEYRRSGFASAVSRFLVDSAVANGAGLVWLTAGDAEAERVYTRLGFRRIGAKQLNYRVSA